MKTLVAANIAVLLGAVGTGLYWAARVEARFDVLEVRMSETERRLSDRIDLRFGELDRRMQRVEARVFPGMHADAGAPMDASVR